MCKVVPNADVTQCEFVLWGEGGENLSCPAKFCNTTRVSEGCYVSNMPEATGPQLANALMGSYDEYNRKRKATMTRSSHGKVYPMQDSGTCYRSAEAAYLQGLHQVGLLGL